MKIGLKLGLCFAIAIIGLIFCVYQGMNGTSTINDMLNTLGKNRFPSVVIINQGIDAANQIDAVAARLYISRNLPDRAAALQEAMTEDLRALDSLSGAVKPFVITEQGQSHLDNFTKKTHVLKACVLKYEELLSLSVKTNLQTDIDAMTNYLRNDLTTANQDLIDAGTEYVNFLTDSANKLVVDSDVVYADLSQQLMIIAVLCIAIVLTAAIVITLGITRPLSKAVHAANQVAAGDMNVDLSTKSKDETGVLMNALQGMVSSVNNVITDTKSLSTATTAGRLEVRADANKHQGAYKELVIGINDTLDAVIGPLNVTAEYIDRISKGDIPAKITDVYRGDFNEIKNNLNGCIDAIGLLVTEINVLIAATVEGKLQTRGNADRHSGDYQHIVKGMNALIEAFVEPIETTSKYLNDIALGATMQPITKEYKGEFNVIKNNINATVGTLLGFLGSVESLTKAAGEGNLDERADASKLAGGWQSIMISVNSMFSIFSDLMNDAGGVLGVMATGDLTPRMTASYKGKFHEMQNNINGLGDSLTDLISQLQTAIHTTASASAQISATAETLAAATQEQSSQTDEVASAVEEMSRTVTDNAQSATKTSDVAKQSGVMANEGGQVVNQTVAKMREIADVVKTSAENITKLGESSKKIGEIISVIDDIADQTNLLALNAAIEAARAGEQGRGFAVVADEVRKLAESTAGATKQIADMIKGIQSDTNLAVVAMKKGTDEVQSGIELADKAGMSLQDILSSINELLDMINQIAAASEEQSATSEQISKNVSTISKVTADSARNVEDVAHTASELARMTDTLTSLVSQFKVHDDNGRGLGGYNGYHQRALN